MRVIVSRRRVRSQHFPLLFFCKMTVSRLFRYVRDVERSKALDAVPSKALDAVPFASPPSERFERVGGDRQHGARRESRARSRGSAGDETRTEPPRAHH